MTFKPCPFGLRKWLDPVVVFFFKNTKNITSVGWSSRCKFFWNALDPTLVIFLPFFEKNYNDWIKTFYKSKWTGLESKKQWLLIQYWLFHSFLQPNSYQKALENVVLFQVIMAFGPLYCNNIAPTPHRWQYKYTIIEKYTFSDYDYWYDWLIKLDRCSWSDNCK